MQLLMQDGILCVRTLDKFIYAEPVSYVNVAHMLATNGYRIVTAQAVAYGVLADREKTIALAQFVKLLAVS